VEEEEDGRKGRQQQHHHRGTGAVWAMVRVRPWTVPGMIGPVDWSSGGDDQSDAPGHGCHLLGGQREQAADGGPQDLS